jgi:hypothetical protein
MLEIAVGRARHSAPEDAAQEGQPRFRHTSPLADSAPKLRRVLRTNRPKLAIRPFRAGRAKVFHAAGLVAAAERLHFVSRSGFAAEVAFSHGAYFVGLTPNQSGAFALPARFSGAIAGPGLLARRAAIESAGYKSATFAHRTLVRRLRRGPRLDFEHRFGFGKCQWRRKKPVEHREAIFSLL